MRIFKHGDSLAIVVPDSLCKKFSFSENSELEFFEAGDGLLVLATRSYIASKLKRDVQPFLQRAPAVPDLLVFSSESEAKAASRKLEPQLRSGDILAVFGADKKYYLISLEYYSKLSSKVAQYLSTEKTLAQLASESGISMRELVPTLAAMKEKGEAIEKKKGSFLLVK